MPTDWDPWPGKTNATVLIGLLALVGVRRGPWRDDRPGALVLKTYDRATGPRGDRVHDCTHRARPE